MVQENLVNIWESNVKKIIIGILYLTFCSISYAGTITVQAFSADSSVTHLEDFRTVVVNEINGKIEGAQGGSVLNISADSIGELDMGDSANPRVFSNELLGVGVDTTTSSNAVRIAGLQPADTGNLTSNISAGQAYINGYRVSKPATAHTYTASRDTYVDLDQNGNFSFSEVANGGAEPSVASNSIRLAKVVTDASEITSVTDESATRLPTLVIPTDFRTGMAVSRDSADTTTLTISPGIVEINNTTLQKTAVTSIDADTAGNWHSGTEDVASSGYVYIGIDTSGNIKFDDTAPSHSNFGVSITDGKLRYATATGSTVVRILGWGYRDGSGNFNTYEYGNIKEADLYNAVLRTDETVDSVNDTAYGSDLTNTTVNFYSSGNPVRVTLSISGDTSANLLASLRLSDGQSVNESQRQIVENANGLFLIADHLEYYGQGTRTFSGAAIVDGNTLNARGKGMYVEEL